MDCLAGDSAQHDEAHSQQGQDRNERVKVIARVDQNEQRAEHSGHHVDSEPALRPVPLRGRPLPEGIAEPQQDDSEADPAGEVPRMGMAEGPVRPRREELFKGECATDGDADEDADEDCAAGQWAQGGSQFSVLTPFSL